MPYKDPQKQKQYQRQWIIDRKDLWFRNRTCVNCGSDTDLQLDHTDPSRKTDHRIWSWSRDRFEKEIKKCQVLCRTCHRQKTKEDNGWFLKHGTVTGYNSYRCRCRPCTDAVVKAGNEYRWRVGTRKKRAKLAQSGSSESLKHSAS